MSSAGSEPDARAEDRWHRADRLFEAALDLPEAERGAFLDASCGGDSQLRELVERLLADADTQEMSFSPGGGLQGPMWDDLARQLAAKRGAVTGELVGRYRLLRELGRGGMAVVYLAERADGQFEQRVALKRIQPGVATAEVIRRFDQERQIVASIRHPAIAQLLDGGVDQEERPYFVMEYVEGRPIDRYCDEERLSIDDRLQLFLRVADAVAHAHRNLIVHRDIKPSNILITADRHAKLLDFGIAKPLDAKALPGLLTRTQGRLMTPVYASPEQISGRPVTTASDVYQLGLLLYQLLSGRWPYRLLDEPAEMARIILREAPTRPSAAVVDAESYPPPGTLEPDPAQLGTLRGTSRPRLRRELAGDLDNIILTALRKEPERRYGSVELLIDDIVRHRTGRPVMARGDSFTYRAGKFLRRHRREVATAMAAFVVIVLLAVFYTVRLKVERDQARIEAAKATEISEFLRTLFVMSSPTTTQGQVITARELLDRGAERIHLELRDQPRVQASLMTLMGDVYRDLAFYDEAAALLLRAVDLRRRWPGPDRLELAESLHTLARVEEEQGDANRAQELYGEALAIREARSDAHDPGIAEILAGLGRVAALRKDFATARGHFERALGILESRLGPRDPKIGKMLADWGVALEENGEHQAARLRLENALEVLAHSYEDDDPRIARVRVDLAETLRFTNELDGARAVYERVLHDLERVYSDSHPDIAEVLSKLGSLLTAMGLTDLAITRHERALAIRREAFGEEHHLVAGSLYNLGQSYWMRRDLSKAQDYFEQSKSIFQRTLGKEHDNVGIVVQSLANIASANGLYEEALGLYEQALEIRQKSHGLNHPHLARLVFYMGVSRMRLHDYPAAEELFRRALELGRDHEPFRLREIFTPRFWLARCLRSLERHEEAEELLLANLENRDLDPASRRSNLEELVALYSETGRLDEARHFEEALMDMARSGSRPSHEERGTPNALGPAQTVQ